MLEKFQNTIWMQTAWIIFLIGSSNINVAQAAPFFKNHSQMVESAHLTSYYKKALTSDKPRIKIAIIDNGFKGYQDAIGKTLPKDTHTEFVAGPLDPPEPQENHGLVMSQIVVELINNGGEYPELNPELYLFNSYGYTNFKNAVDQVIANKIDIVLYSQVWEYGGNMDGRGFINSEINRALEAGTLWINAAGDFGSLTFNTAIKPGTDDWISLPNSNNSIKIECRPVKSKKTCPLRSVATWNDFKDQAELGTSHDLDFFLFDDTLNILTSSSLQQTEKIPDGSTGYSLYPREIIQHTLNEGTYYLRLKNRSKNFSARDAVRITASGEGIIMPSADKDESLPVGADNPGVITVAGTELNENSRSLSLRKPELIAYSTIEMPKENTESESEQSPSTARGSSTAAALVTGSLALYKTVYPQIKDKKSILERVRSSSARNNLPTNLGTGLPLSTLRFAPTQGRNCFTPVRKLEKLPSYLSPLYDRGGVPVFTTAGVKIFFVEDPFTLTPHIRRFAPDDVLMKEPNGYGLYPRRDLQILPPEYYEMVQIPQGQWICREDVGEVSQKNYQNPNFQLP